MLNPHIEAMKRAMVTSSVTGAMSNGRPKTTLPIATLNVAVTSDSASANSWKPASQLNLGAGATNRLPMVPVWRSRSRISEALNTMPNSSASPAPATTA